MAIKHDDTSVDALYENVLHSILDLQLGEEVFDFGARLTDCEDTARRLRKLAARIEIGQIPKERAYFR